MGLVLIALLTVLCAPPAADAGVGNTAHLKYKVIGFNYTATGLLAGGIIPKGCVGIALWEAALITDGEADLLSTYAGQGALTIHGSGSSGRVDAKADAESTLGTTFHRITTACNEQEEETAFKMTECGGATLKSKVHASVRISGGVGNQVKLSWDFVQYGGASGGLVPDSFTCVEPLKFPDKACTTRASLAAFNRTFVNLPFKCFFSTTTPPPGSNYKRYESNVLAHGTLKLKLKK